jgi:hypothetical protein
VSLCRSQEKLELTDKIQKLQGELIEQLEFNNSLSAKYSDLLVKYAEAIQEKK